MGKQHKSMNTNGLWKITLEMAIEINKHPKKYLLWSTQRLWFQERVLQKINTPRVFGQLAWQATFS